MRKKLNNDPRTGVGKLEIGQKIRQLRLQCGLNQPQLAQMLGVTKNAVTNWETGISRPEISTIKQLCGVLGVSADTLLDLPNHANDVSIKDLEHLRIYKKLSVYDRRSVDTLMDAMLQNQQDSIRAVCQNNCTRISRSPLKASAGSGNLLDDSDDADYLYLYNSRSVCLADEVITVTGDSMVPTFQNGEDLLVQHTEFLRPGDIGIFVINGDGYVKEYQRDGLHSHNPRYSIIVPGEADVVRVIGRVLGNVTEDMRVSEQEALILDEIYRS